MPILQIEILKGRTIEQKREIVKKVNCIPIPSLPSVESPGIGSPNQALAGRATER